MTATGLLPSTGDTDRDWLAALAAAFDTRACDQARRCLADLVDAVLADHDLGWLTVDDVDTAGRWDRPALQIHVTCDRPDLRLDLLAEDGEVSLRGSADGHLWDAVEAAGQDLAGRVGPEHERALLHLRGSAIAAVLADELDRPEPAALIDDLAQELLVTALVQHGHPAAGTAATLSADWSGSARELADTLARLVPGG